MAFRYPLQSLLRLRESLERQEEQRLFALAVVASRLRGRLEELLRSEQDVRRAELQEIASGTPGAFIQFAEFRDNTAQNVRRRLESELARAEQKRLGQLAVYQTARQNREVLQGLREQQETAYELEIERREQRDLDDAFLIRKRSSLDE